MTITSYERYLAEELENFQEIAKALKPSSGNVPSLRGIDICGTSIPLNGVIGGDHTIYLDFAKRFDMKRRIREATKAGQAEVAANLINVTHRAGILLADVAGHRVTDALIAAMLHQAFLLGVYYELDRFGEITTKLFEHINQRFFTSTNINRYLTMIYGEISDEGRFRFISAGHPPPMVFSREFSCFVHISEELMTTYPPVGIFASHGEPDEEVDPGS
ncbi:MAG: SpoIIE family protein phosphatase, partial [Acidobacteriota bacterium]